MVVVGGGGGGGGANFCCFGFYSCCCCSSSGEKLRIMKENKQYIYVKTTMDRVDALSKQLTKHVDGLSNQLSDHIDLNSVRCSGASCVFVCVVCFVCC